MGKIIILFLLLSLPLMARSSSYQNALEEVRIALMDVQKAYSQQKVELEVLEEKIHKIQNMRELQNRISEIEKTQEKILADLRQLTGHANQTSNALSLLEKQIEQTSQRISEIAQLKNTLHSISKAMGCSSSNTHKVASGDSLEKIARKYNTNIEALKQINGLTSNTIIIGQELKIPQ